MKLKRICPICNCENGELLHSIDFAKANDEYVPEHYDIVACENCGFIFNDTDWKQENYDKYYSLTHKYIYLYSDKSGAISPKEAEKYTEEANIIKIFSSYDSSLLEIGCGKGGLLKTLKKIGYKDLSGVDIGVYQNDDLKNNNIKYINSSFFDMSKNINHKYDVIISSQVFEHIYDINLLAKNVDSILKDDGILYIAVPDSSEYKSHFIKPYHYFDFEHINHFDPNSLSNLFHNYEILYTKSISENIIDNISYPTLCMVFRKKKEKSNIKVDKKYIANIKDYINISKSNQEFNIIDIDNSKKTFFWGGGAYLRRILKDNRYYNNINISGIIDINKSLNGLKIKTHRDYDIEFVSPDIIDMNKDYNIIITSALFGTSIKKNLIDKNFKGKVYIAEQSRAEQSRAEQSRAEQSIYLMLHNNYEEVA